MKKTFITLMTVIALAAMGVGIQIYFAPALYADPPPPGPKPP